MLPLTVCGTGCSLVDLLNTDIDLEGEAFSTFRPRSPGGGGLAPGKAVLDDELRRLAG